MTEHLQMETFLLRLSGFLPSAIKSVSNREPTLLVLWIRVGFKSDPAFKSMGDPDPVPDPGVFYDQKWKTFLEKKLRFD